MTLESEAGRIQKAVPTKKKKASPTRSQCLCPLLGRPQKGCRRRCLSQPAMRPEPNIPRARGAQGLALGWAGLKVSAGWSEHFYPLALSWTRSNFRKYGTRINELVRKLRKKKRCKPEPISTHNVTSWPKDTEEALQQNPGNAGQRTWRREGSGLFFLVRIQQEQANFSQSVGIAVQQSQEDRTVCKAPLPIFPGTPVCPTLATLSQVKG